MVVEKEARLAVQRGESEVALMAVKVVCKKELMRESLSV